MSSRLVFLAVLGLLLIAFKVSPLLSDSRGSVDITSSHKIHCVDIDLHQDRCAFVQQACSGFSGIYLRFYYCSTLWKPITISILLGGLLLLFGAVSVVASDFFCPNLQTISSKLQLSESMAGVTVLAFGNGSPDLFSTFSAMDSGAGSLAIGELIGAAFFIVSIVSGCMGIIRPFKSKRITFMRDASFLTGAITIITWIVYHQKIQWYHGVALIAYYLTYVFAVVFSAYSASPDPVDPLDTERKLEEELATETSRLLGAPVSKNSRPPRLSIPDHGFSVQQSSSMSDYEPHLGNIIRPMSPLSSSRPSLRIDTMNVPRTVSTNGSMSARVIRRAMTPRVGIRTSLFGAIEFQEQISAIRRATSSAYSIDPAQRRRQVSMPPEMWQRSSTHTSVPGHAACARQARRTRSSTVTEQLAVARPGRGSRTPDSTHSSTGVAEDYFTYLSAAQPSITHAPPPHSSVPRTSMSDHHPELMIPEIRLAPPNTDIPHLQPLQLSTVDERHLPLSATSRRTDPTSLNVPLSPSRSTISEYDCYVTARQSPETSPHPSTDDRLSIAIVLPGPDDFGVRPVIVDELLNKSTIPTPSRFATAMDEVCQVLFPTLQNWHDKSIFSKLSSLVAMPVVFVFTLTLPVAEPEDVKVDDLEVANDDAPLGDATASKADSNHKNYLTVPPSDSECMMDDTLLLAGLEQEVDIQQAWCRWLLATQAIVSLTFIFGVMAVNGFIPYVYMVIGLGVGCVLALVVITNTKADEPPKWFWMLSFAGFFVALHWIFLLANEMVGLLQALGKILGISDAIMGLTIFALGNSIGDLVANTAIAKMGFPTMAISACYAGPLLNMVLGVGISSTYQTWVTGKPYALDIAPTILVSSAGLITVLLSTLVVVNLNGYHINQYLGWWMIAVYTFCCVVNFLLEFGVFQ